MLENLDNLGTKWLQSSPPSPKSPQLPTPPPPTTRPPLLLAASLQHNHCPCCACDCFQKYCLLNLQLSIKHCLLQFIPQQGVSVITWSKFFEHCLWWWSLFLFAWSAFSSSCLCPLSFSFCALICICSCVIIGLVSIVGSTCSYSCSGDLVRDGTLSVKLSWMQILNKLP